MIRLGIFNPNLEGFEIVNRLIVLCLWVAAAWVNRWSAHSGPLDWRPIRVAAGALCVICAITQSVLLFTDIDPRTWSKWAVCLNYPTIIVLAIGTPVFSVSRWRAFKADIARLEDEGPPPL